MGALAGRRVVVGVSGGIAAFKAVELCRRLQDEGAYVQPVLTEDALRFVGALTFSALCSEKARTSLWDDPYGAPSPHITLGKGADLVVVAPATARLLGRLAAGISDDLLTATLLATRAPVLVAPAMHTEMWQHAAVQANMATLAARGVHVVGPVSGALASGDHGSGRMADPADIVAAAEQVLAASLPGDLVGVRVVVSAGGTREAIDPVRFIGNRSSGKQGLAIAAAAARRGALVTLITTVAGPAPAGVGATVLVESAAQMQTAVDEAAATADVVVMAAAVADFRPREVAAHKIKKADASGPVGVAADGVGGSGDVPSIVLERTPDILAGLGARKRPGQILVGFAAETQDLAASAQGKLVRKNLDLIVANDVSAPKVGFEHDTNAVTIFAADGTVEALSLRSKDAVADAVLDRVVAVRGSLPG